MRPLHRNSTLRASLVSLLLPLCGCGQSNSTESSAQSSSVASSEKPTRPSPTVPTDGLPQKLAVTEQTQGASAPMPPQAGRSEQGDQTVQPTPPPSTPPHNAGLSGIPGSPPGTQPAGGIRSPALAIQLSTQAKEAIALASSGTPADRQKLAPLLLDQSWLNSLDPPEVAQSISSQSLQLSQVLRVVAAKAPELLEPLAASKLYRESEYRLPSLIEATQYTTQPGPEVVSLWKSQLSMEADELETTIRAMIAGKSDAGADLFAATLCDEDFDTDFVTSWLHDPVLRHRQDIPLLKAFDRIIDSSKLSAERRSLLFEALFEYLPQVWYISPDAPPSPPKRADLSEDARALLKKFADAAVKSGDMPPARRQSVEAELAPVP